MAFIDGFRLCEAEERTYVLAYGSNLNLERMADRCPSMKVVGKTVIPAYRMLFKESKTGAYLTIEQDANGNVPAVVYEIDYADEIHLDRLEGCPKYYYKREFLLPVWNLEGKRLRNRRPCIAYIIHEERMLGMPTREYYRIVETGYEQWGIDKKFLKEALSASIGAKAAETWLKKREGKKK